MATAETADPNDSAPSASADAELQAEAQVWSAAYAAVWADERRREPRQYPNWNRVHTHSAREADVAVQSWRDRERRIAA